MQNVRETGTRRSNMTISDCCADRVARVNRSVIRVHANKGSEVVSTHSAKRAEFYKQRSVNGLQMSMKLTKSKCMGLKKK